jgi:D-glycero-D-manno-heptose 1,7-bisphosphate phosphatase
MNRAVFLDRDGTINEEVGYLRSLDMLKMIPGAGAAIRRLNDAGFKVVIITNQSGVARGYFPESLVHDAHALLTEMLLRDGATVDGIYYCPHHPTAGSSKHTVVCDCRKPATGLLDRAANDLHIDLKSSFVVGDKWSDVELGHRAGARAILVRSGFAHDDPGNMRKSHVQDPDFTAHDLAEAATWIIGQGGAGGR